MLVKKGTFIIQNQKISILLATYRPNWEFFKLLLISLNDQDYPHLELLVRDDSDQIETSEKIQEYLREFVTAMPYVFTINERNMGSNRTFELLTEEVANGGYLAYCDQDDVWEPEKLSTLAALIEGPGVTLAYSDLSVIDQDGNKKADSFREFQKRVIHIYGADLFGTLLMRNSVTGCSMLIDTDVAKRALPFSQYFVHDHWLTLVASSVGELAYSAKPLIQYRLHDNNQIGASMLPGINNKTDYVEKKLAQDTVRFNSLLAGDLFTAEQKALIQGKIAAVEDRKAFIQSPSLSGIGKLFKALQGDHQLFLVELFLGIAGNKLGERFLKFLKR